MDPIAIILTVFACLAGLALLGLAAYVALAMYLFSRAKKSIGFL